MLRLTHRNSLSLDNVTLRAFLIVAIALPTLAVCAEPVAPVRAATVVRADERSGRLVRSVKVVRGVAVTPAETAVAAEVEAPAVDEPRHLTLVELIDKISAEIGVEAPLVHSVIRAESNYNPTALSPKGAQGLMQLIPSTAKRFGVRNSYDPQDNIQGGVKYLKFLLEYFQGDYARAIAAYNAGENAVDRYKGIPPYAETRNYVYAVAKNLKVARALEAKKAAELVPVSAVETTITIQASIGQDGKVYYRTP